MELNRQVSHYSRVDKPNYGIRLGLLDFSQTPQVFLHLEVEGEARGTMLVAICNVTVPCVLNPTFSSYMAAKVCKSLCPMNAFIGVHKKHTYYIVFPLA
ncbi:hypothetical protein GBF38_021960 [Nibea albiflora]|uniref:Uncharacterized protein n=1 Tax=Nibea albiflora TaxID=240163 RepID=A0ACB7FH58_NIBAL|nr:hypothetical protein GBF38_021960 [Nibea albiflora]